MKNADPPVFENAQYKSDVQNPEEIVLKSIEKWLSCHECGDCVVVPSSEGKII
jgi:hypothetical protein